MKLDLLKRKAKHSLAGLTLACTTMSPCAMAQNQSDKDDDKVAHVAETLENDTVSTNKSTYLDFGVQNVMGVQTTGHDVYFMDRASLGLNVGFEKNKWHGNVSAEGTVKLRNKDINASLTQATMTLGKKVFRSSDIGVIVGREYTENDVFNGKTRFIDYNVADVYRDFYGNLSDKLTAFYKTDKGLCVELGVIERADSTFYLVPDFKKTDFFAKVMFDTKTNKNMQFTGSGATELGKNARNIMGDFGVNGSNWGFLIGAKYDLSNDYWGIYATGNYISKRDFRYILSLAKYYYIYKVQAGIEKKNVMFFVNVDTAKKYAAFNAGLSWMLDYKQKSR